MWWTSLDLILDKIKGKQRSQALASYHCLIVGSEMVRPLSSDPLPPIHSCRVEQSFVAKVLLLQVEVVPRSLLVDLLLPVSLSCTHFPLLPFSSCLSLYFSLCLSLSRCLSFSPPPPPLSIILDFKLFLWEYETLIHRTPISLTHTHFSLYLSLLYHALFTVLPLHFSYLVDLLPS